MFGLFKEWDQSAQNQTKNGKSSGFSNFVKPIVPQGKTVDEKLKSLQSNPLYNDQNDRRLFNHVTEEYKRAYPGNIQHDEFGKMQRPSKPSIQPDQVRAFDPDGVLGKTRQANTRGQVGAKQPALPGASGRSGMNLAGQVLDSGAEAIPKLGKPIMPPSKKSPQYPSQDALAIGRNKGHGTTITLWQDHREKPIEHTMEATEETKRNSREMLRSSTGQNSFVGGEERDDLIQEQEIGFGKGRGDFVTGPDLHEENVEDIIQNTNDPDDIKKWYAEKADSSKVDWSEELSDARDRGNDLGEDIGTLNPDIVAKSRAGHEDFQHRQIERQAEHDEFQAQMHSGMFSQTPEAIDQTVDLFNRVAKSDPGLIHNLPPKLSAPAHAYNDAIANGATKPEARDLAMRVASEHYMQEMWDHAQDKADHVAKLGAMGANDKDLDPNAVARWERNNLNKHIPKNIQGQPRMKIFGHVADVASSITANPVRNMTSGNAEGRMLAKQFGAGKTAQNVAGLAGGLFSTATGGTSKAVISKGGRMLFREAAKKGGKSSILKGVAGDAVSTAIKSGAKEGYNWLDDKQDIND